MDTKLTLRLDKFVIENAKKYAKDHNKSLSRLIEAYLKSLISSENKEEEIQISPFVKSMATGVNLPADLDYKTEFLNFITEKHQ